MLVVRTNPDEIQERADEFESKFPGRISSLVGIDNAESLDEFRENIVEKAHGGNNAKSSRKISGLVNTFLTIIKGSKTCLEKVLKVYDKHLKTVSDFRKKIEKVGGELDASKATTGTAHEKITSAYAAVYKAEYDRIMKACSMYETYMGAMRTVNESLVKEMVKEMMGACEKFASFKAKKE